MQQRAGDVLECANSNHHPQNAKTAWKKMRRAAEPEEKIPPARLVDLPNWLPGPYSPVLVFSVGITLPTGCAIVDVVEQVHGLGIEGERVFAAGVERRPPGAPRPPPPPPPPKGPANAAAATACPRPWRRSTGVARFELGAKSEGAADAQVHRHRGRAIAQIHRNWRIAPRGRCRLRVQAAERGLRIAWVRTGAVRTVGKRGAVVEEVVAGQVVGGDDVEGLPDCAIRKGLKRMAQGAW